MVDGINWNVDLNKINPFTGAAVTDADIEVVDTDGDKNLTKAEWETASVYYISGGDDGEGDVKVGEESDFLLTLTNNEELKETVKTRAEAESQIKIIADEYQEYYFNTHYGLSDEERTEIKTLIAQTMNNLINECKKMQGPFNIKELAALFETNLNETIEKRTEAKGLNNQKIDGYVDYKDSALMDMFDLTMSATENGNISQSEFNQIKAATIKYLMGMLLSGEIDNDLVSQLQKSSKGGSAKYTKAKAEIDKIKNETDPEKIKQYLINAEKYIQEFVDSMDKDKFADSITEIKAAKVEDATRQILDTYLDSYYEKSITKDMTDEQVQYLKQFMTTCENKFISKLAEAGTMDTFTDATLIKSFEEYVQQQLQKLVQSQVEAATAATQITQNFDNLVSISDRAKENGNISEEERTQLVDAGTKLVLSQIMAGMTDSVFLDKAVPGYQSTSEWNELVTILNKLNNSADADELEDCMKKAEELIKALLEKSTGDKLVAAVDALKPVNVTDKMKDKALLNSDLYSDYEGGTSRATGYGKQNDNSLNEIQEMAKKDLETYAESMKAQLQKELGEAYNEEEVQKYINDAIYDTLAIFTSNIYRTNGHGHYNAGEDEQAFVFKRRSGTHKGRYVYNVKALIDTFTERFNAASIQKNPVKLDKSLATYDMENAIYRTEGLGNDYYHNKSETVKGSSRDDGKAYAELIARAKSELKALGEQIKASLKEEGLDVPESKVDDWIDQCIADTISEMKEAFQVCHPDGSVTGGKVLDQTLAAGVGYGAVVGSAAAAAGVGAFVAGTSSAAIASLSAEQIAFLTAFKGATMATEFGAVAGTQLATATAVSSAVPIVGWCVAGAIVATMALKKWTNIFGATYGQHNQNAGFYFERKSNSHSGKFGYDTQTLVNLFLNKFNEKLADWKKEEQDKKTKGQEIS